MASCHLAVGCETMARAVHDGAGQRVAGWVAPPTPHPPGWQLVGACAQVLVLGNMTKPHAGGLQECTPCQDIGVVPPTDPASMQEASLAHHNMSTMSC